MASPETVDILMITFNAPGYVERSLPALLDACDEHCRVWLWHNGDHEETLEVSRRFASDDRVYRFHHSHENVKLTEPTNWMWSQATGAFLSKVDDDCLLPADWIDRMRQAHRGDPSIGVVGASRLRPEDIDARRLARKREQRANTELVRNHWVQGSGYLLSREWQQKQGPLTEGQSWTNWCLDLARRGAVNGFVWPLVFEDHMDDPRSPNTLLHSDDDLAWRMPLSAKRSRVESLEDWQRRLERSAREIQRAPVGIKHYDGWRLKMRHAQDRLARLLPA